MTNRSSRAAWALGSLVLVLAAAIGCLGGGKPMESSRHPTRSIEAVMADHTPRLMAMEGVVAVGQGALRDGTPCIKIFLKHDDEELKKRLPAELEGHPVEVVIAGEIRAMPGDGR